MNTLFVEKGFFNFQISEVDYEITIFCEQNKKNVKFRSSSIIEKNRLYRIEL